MQVRRFAARYGTAAFPCALKMWLAGRGLSQLVLLILVYCSANVVHSRPNDSRAVAWSEVQFWNSLERHDVEEIVLKTDILLTRQSGSVVVSRNVTISTDVSNGATPPMLFTQDVTDLVRLEPDSTLLIVNVGLHECRVAANYALGIVNASAGGVVIFRNVTRLASVCSGWSISTLNVSGTDMPRDDGHSARPFDLSECHEHQVEYCTGRNHPRKGFTWPKAVAGVFVERYASVYAAADAGMEKSKKRRDSSISGDYVGRPPLQVMEKVHLFCLSVDTEDNMSSSSAHCRQNSPYFMHGWLKILLAFCLPAIHVLLSLWLNKTAPPPPPPPLPTEKVRPGTVDDVILKGLIAVGGFSKVYKAEYKQVTVAAKICSAPLGCEEPLMRELEISLSVDHPNVVRCLGGWLVNASTELQVWLLQPLCRVGDLAHYCTTNKFFFDDTPILDLRNVLQRLKDIARGMDYLHGLGVVHGDLKASNVLLYPSAQDQYGIVAKVCDFGLSKQSMSRTHFSLESLSGTASHVSPEVISGLHLRKHSDVYAFGVLMNEVVERVPPYTGMLSIEILEGVAAGKLRPRFSAHIPKPYVHLAEACWHQKPLARPTFTEVVSRLEFLLRMVDGMQQRLEAAICMFDAGF